MVWCVSTDHDVKHSRLSMQVSTRAMVTKRLSRWSFGCWSPLDYVFFLLLLLLCLPVTSSTNGTTIGISTSTPSTELSNSITATGGNTAIITTTNSSSTKGSSNSSTVPLTTSHDVQNTTTMLETTVTSSNISTMIPATTFTTESRRTDNQTVESTPYTSTGNTTSFETTANFTSTRNTTSFETTANFTFTGYTTSFETTANFTSTRNTTSFETTANFTSTGNTTSFETTANFTSTGNTTSFETTANFTSTGNTTSFETTTNLTTFTATPGPSPSANITDTTPTINQTSATTAPTPCNFNQSCVKAFYWMTVNVTRTLENEIPIRTWLEQLYKSKLNACAVSIKSVTAVGEISDGISLTNVLTTTSISTETPIFEGIEVTCDPKNSTKDALCNILLQLSAPDNVCCISDAVVKMSSENVTVRLVGTIERVGVCANNSPILSGQYDKCSQTAISVDVCAAGPRNISCGNNTNVIFPLATGLQDICPTSPPPQTCRCSSRCNNSDFYYYHFNVRWNQYLVSNLAQSDVGVIGCINSNQGDTEAPASNCSVIVKLDTAMDPCDVRSVVEAISELQKNFTLDGVVSTVAVCSYSLDSLSEYFIWNPSLSTNFSSESCMETDRGNLWTDYCLTGDNYEGRPSIVIPLNGSCISSAPTFTNSTTTPPSSTSSSLSNTTIINATVSTTESVNVTTSPANVTASETLDAEGLLKLSANASSLNSTQVDQILSQLESLLSGPTISLAVANTSVSIVNNLLDVPVAVMTPFSKRAIGVVDTVGLKLIVSGTSQSIVSQSLALAVKKVDGTNFQETSFSLTEASSVQIRSNLSMETEDIMVQVRSTPLGSVILPASLTQNLTADQQRLASRVQFNFFQKNTFFQDKALGERKINSGIVSSSVANLSISGLQNKVLITLRNTGPIPANYVSYCVFWDFGLNGGSGGWSSSGCHALNTSAEETQCACNHLTSFGILLDISKTNINGLQADILTYITYIGCGISAIFLSITLLTYLAFGKLRKDIPSKILIQLCLALLLLNLVFLLDAWLALYPNAVGLCISTAFFLHYFLLASFTWMALEAVHMYLALVKVFNTYITRFMVKIGLAGWGIPLVVVIIVIAINKDHYGLVTYGRYASGATDDFCWIKNDIVFYVAVVAYFCLVFLLNFTMFIVVLIQLCRIKRQNPHNVQNRSGWQEMRSVAGLTVLLGLTWGFAFFAWGPVNLAFMYLFAIFNTLQGFFIFVFHCAMKENVRRQWRTYLCCGTLRLAENSEWSRTATQKINKANKKRDFSFRSANSNNSSSSFLNHDTLVSDTPVDVSNPMDDRTITAAEEPSSGSDVVLNELNDQYRGQRSY
ncbi:adhesion G-protein coupled receptor G6-like [Carassius carassius]|uniref:adhesion G-protein coupled receptor G6-like n=1 Tax=Carassius carassius TaxID=217509 RepID=UPI002868B59F|nr:adhesion G-protein coupled receptor G6-like [Carassius carassius]